MAKKIKEFEVNKNMSFAEIINKYPESIEILLEKGMHCIGCPMSSGESLEQGAIAHDLDPDKLVEEINKKIKGGK